MIVICVLFLSRIIKVCEEVHYAHNQTHEFLVLFIFFFVKCQNMKKHQEKNMPGQAQALALGSTIVAIV